MGDVAFYKGSAFFIENGEGSFLGASKDERTFSSSVLVGGSSIGFDTYSTTTFFLAKTY